MPSRVACASRYLRGVGEILRGTCAAVSRAHAGYTSLGGGLRYLACGSQPSGCVERLAGRSGHKTSLAVACGGMASCGISVRVT